MKQIVMIIIITTTISPCSGLYPTRNDILSACDDQVRSSLLEAESLGCAPEGPFGSLRTRRGSWKWEIAVCCGSRIGYFNDLICSMRYFLREIYLTTCKGTFQFYHILGGSTSVDSSYFNVNSHIKQGFRL